MLLHVPTLVVVLIGVCLLSGAAIMLRWARSGRSDYLLCWSLALLAAGVVFSLLMLRGTAPDWLTIAIANALALVALGLTWNGIRLFDRRRPFWALPLVLPALWLASCTVPEIYGSFANRSLVASFLVAVASLALGYQVWFGRSDYLAARWPLAALCLVHATVSILRIGYILWHGSAGVEGTDLFTSLGLLELIFVLFALMIFGLGLTQQRTEGVLRRLASEDGLTGLLNRTAFIEQSEAMIRQAGREHANVGLILCDLDRFKSINDHYGHAAGDQVLVAFADIVRGALRSDDLVCRLGGEEFAALLIGVDDTVAIRIAERMRADLSRARIMFEEVRLSATVSIGFASAPGERADLASLMARADSALYKAKRSGRDLVQPAA
ncbi:diguanylate cyclase [Kaistia dalseonensis]|uniref:diguanylate cyclase n=1 Tax=Kaistia dalseonensis TaxID=410840 RepID=A0ABU0H142_9HYPH|nr:diguanylate cyclase [Kaistia dalseonensis]MCX5493469.1 diguanylate cyclase [Kaistia dalseonensis]MDQ0436028.1 diguanylate cyclase (GGDEF)-like protein [Kaistia dalseonensis]